MGGINIYDAGVKTVLSIMLCVSLSHGAITLKGVLPSAATAEVNISPGVLDLQEAFVRIARQVKPAVVNIATVYREQNAPPKSGEFFFDSPFEDFFSDFFGQEQPKERRRGRRSEGNGSGVIIDPDGYILTNEHVIRDAREIKVTLDDGKTYNARVVGKDARSDLAIVKIKTGRKMQFARLGDSSGIRVGDWAIAIGSPFGLEETVTSGIVSAVRQSVSIEGKEYRDLIQTDAAINRGNSGGPLCNIRGEIVGINTAIFAPTGVFSGIGFAVPINSARSILDDLIEKGKVVRGWLGVEIKDVDGVIARQFGLPDVFGVLINDVVRGSPAAYADLRRGDIIREFDGKTIKDARGLQDAVSGTEPRRTVTVKIVRDRREASVRLVTGELPAEEEADTRKRHEPASPAGTTSIEWQGMMVTSVDEDLAREHDISVSEDGCVVVEVEPGTPASEMGLMQGDLIRAVNRVLTPTLKEFREAAKAVKPEDGIILDISRRGRLLYISYVGEIR